MGERYTVPVKGDSETFLAEEAKRQAEARSGIGKFRYIGRTQSQVYAFTGQGARRIQADFTFETLD